MTDSVDLGEARALQYRIDRQREKELSIRVDRAEKLMLRVLAASNQPQPAMQLFEKVRTAFTQAGYHKDGDLSYLSLTDCQRAMLYLLTEGHIEMVDLNLRIRAV